MYQRGLRQTAHVPSVAGPDPSWPGGSVVEVSALRRSINGTLRGESRRIVALAAERFEPTKSPAGWRGSGAAAGADAPEWAQVSGRPRDPRYRPRDWPRARHPRWRDASHR